MMNRCIALFTGGKESVFSVLKAREQGYEIDELIFLKKPSFSVHKVNLPAIRAVAKMLSIELNVLESGDKPEDDKALITYLKKKRENGVNNLITGNVKLEETHDIYQKLCEKVGLRLIEPLRGWNTLELLIEYSKIDLQFMIIGIRDEELDPKWLGATISKQNIENFIEEVLSKGVDPCGEYGEYHSIVIQLKNFSSGLKSNFILKGESACINYLQLVNPQTIETNNKW